MDSIKVEVTLPESFLTQLNEFIHKAVSDALKENIAAVRTQSSAVTIKEACVRLTVSRTHLNDLIKSGNIQTIKSGRRKLIPESEIENYLKKSA